MDAWRDIPEAAAALHRRALVFDAHADTLTELTDRGYDLDAGPPGSHLDFPRCAEGVLDAQVFTCFVHPRHVGRDAAARVRAQLDTFDRQQARFPHRIARCVRRGDIAAARASGRLAAVLAIEGGHALENDLSVLVEFHRRGVRSLTLTWNNGNEWADGCGEPPRHGGLSARGRQILTALEALGWVVDISHVAPATFDAALAQVTRPPIASHSCARALRDHPRNLTDMQLRDLAAAGGVVGLNVYPTFLRAEGEATLEDVVAHALHLLEVAGEAHVALGCDYDGITRTPVDLPDVSALPRLTAALLQRGVPERVVTGLLGANLLRVFETALPENAAAAELAALRVMSGMFGPLRETHAARDDHAAAAGAP